MRGMMTQSCLKASGKRLLGTFLGQAAFMVLGSWSIPRAWNCPNSISVFGRDGKGIQLPMDLISVTQFEDIPLQKRLAEIMAGRPSGDG